MSTATLPDVTTSTARQRSIAAKYIREHRRKEAVRGAASLRAAASGLAHEVAALTLRGEREDAQEYAAAMKLVSDRAMRIANATTITYYMKEVAVVDGEYVSEEEAMDHLERNITRFIDDPEPAEIFTDILDSEACRSIGSLAYRPDTGKWNLARYGAWSAEDHRAASQALRRLQRRGGPQESDSECNKRVTPKGFPFLFYRIARPLDDLRIHEVFNVDLPTAPRTVAPFIDPIESEGVLVNTITQDDVDLMFHCHDEAQFDGKAEIADDPRPVEIFRCPKTNRIMRRIGVSRYDETTGKFLAVAFEGATGLDHARIWNAPSFSLENKPLGADVLAATTIHTREDGTRYADVSIARPLDDCNAEELAGIAHDLFELITNPDATAEGEWGENRVFLEVTA
ncbi:hypothetical protein [Sanguibacter sp. HDW7]|uniref:hypothetical protein n=1 Tax=Sanguibacter sp. HDW7 TaxID=2714931 RepID=UPI0014079B13|nr:hypothetical protein [Sanguibacter sp. HDW7]QIK82638.1 hypothetical protein G7063_02655 [Sanguibacter sp. HDW7]